MQTSHWVRSGLVLSILGAAGLVASLPASAQTPSTTTPAAPMAKAGDDNATEFAKLDKNKDGYLDKGEAMMEPKVLGKWADADADKDGKISKDEFLKFEAKEHPAKK